MSEDNSWVFDSLVCFLHGPVWNAPLQTFIEEKSLIFDPNEESINENNPEYKIIHDEYKNLVDYMLGSFMEEMQITPELFEIACLEGRQNGADNSLSFHQGLFQQLLNDETLCIYLLHTQIWAANDIRIFIRMMTQRNVELQLQALDLIERRQNSLQDENNSNKDEHEIDDIAQYEIEKTFVTDEDAEKEIIKSVEEETNINEPQKLNLKAAEEERDHDEGNESNEKFKRLNLFFEQDRVTSADVKSRQEYLRAQRDKILEIKKKARAYQLNESVKRNGRPTSAQAAEKLLQQSTSNGGKGITINHNEINNEASLQLRKTLAKRLRSEVVGKD